MISPIYSSPRVQGTGKWDNGGIILNGNSYAAIGITSAELDQRR